MSSFVSYCGSWLPHAEDLTSMNYYTKLLTFGLLSNQVSVHMFVESICLLINPLSDQQNLLVFCHTSITMNKEIQENLRTTYGPQTSKLSTTCGSQTGKGLKLSFGFVMLVVHSSVFESNLFLVPLGAPK